jgi:hypothetical protein
VLQAGNSGRSVSPSSKKSIAPALLLLLLFCLGVVVYFYYLQPGPATKSQMASNATNSHQSSSATSNVVTPESLGAMPINVELLRQSLMNGAQGKTEFPYDPGAENMHGVQYRNLEAENRQATQFSCKLHLYDAVLQSVEYKKLKDLVYAEAKWEVDKDCTPVYSDIGDQLQKTNPNIYKTYYSRQKTTFFRTYIWKKDINGLFGWGPDEMGVLQKLKYSEARQATNTAELTKEARERQDAEYQAQQDSKRKEQSQAARVQELLNQQKKAQ